MGKKWRILILYFFICNSIVSQTIWTVGPMIHCNFGGEKKRWSWALEFAYWNFSHFPYSFDFATEFEHQKIRFYSEAQTGIGLAGLACGPVLEIQTDKSKLKFGFQASAWGNYFFGGDLRLRFIDKNIFFSPGIYLKTGFAPRDENGDPITGGGSSGVHHISHHHH